jgi:oxygen-independent coproporphyrinogen-3 oxidase
MMGLRVNEGLDRARFARLAGRPLEAVVNPGSVEKLVAGDFLADTGLILRATPSGRLTLNAVLRELLA